MLGDWWDRSLFGVAVAALVVGVWQPPWIGWIEAGALTFGAIWTVRTLWWLRRVGREVDEAVAIRSAVGRQALAELRAAERRLLGR